MGQTERLYRLRSWLDAGRCLSRAWLQQELGISRSTLTRDIAHLRDRMNAPVVYDAERRGWRIEKQRQLPGGQVELPGLWFNAEEVAALLTMQHLLGRLDPGGLVATHIEPLRRRLARMLGAGLPAEAEVARRIRITTVATRKVHLPHFEAVASALLQRRRLVIGYHSRSRGSSDERVVSPQRLAHYRDNWYLDAWCHRRDALRSFAVDAIHTTRILDQHARDIPDAELDAELGAGYGIFAGAQVQWATLRFSPDRARWVAAETWHPEQHGRYDGEGRWLLTLPYADPRELVMDILRHVPEVEVLAPAELEEEVRRRLKAGLEGMGEAG